LAASREKKEKRVKKGADHPVGYVKAKTDKKQKNSWYLTLKCQEPISFSKKIKTLKKK